MALAAYYQGKQKLRRAKLLDDRTDHGQRGQAPGGATPGAGARPRAQRVRHRRGVVTGALVTAALLAAALAVTGCGGGDDKGGSASAPRSVTVPISDFKYAPATVSVRAGGEVRWLNRDRAPHTASVAGGTGFDTGTLRTGASRSLAPRSPGGTPTRACSIPS